MANLRMLHQQLAISFNEGELRTLCITIDVDYDDLLGQGKSDKVRELILYLRRRQEMDRLLEMLNESRPNINWSELIDVSQVAARSVAQLTTFLADKNQSEGKQVYEAIQKRLEQDKEATAYVWQRFLAAPQKRQATMREFLEEILEIDPKFAELLHQLVQVNDAEISKKVEINIYGGQIGQMINAENINSVNGDFVFGDYTNKKSE